MAKFADKMEKIADTVTEGYQKIEDGVVSSFTGMTDKFVDTFLAKKGETVKAAKARIAEEQAKCEAGAKNAAEKRAAQQEELIRSSIEASKNAGKKV